MRIFFESHKNLVQQKQFYRESYDVIDPISKIFVKEVIRYLIHIKNK